MVVMGEAQRRLMMMELAVWFGLSQCSLAIAIIIHQIPHLGSGVHMSPLVGLGWYIVSISIILFYRPWNRGRRVMGPVKKTALQIACLLGALAMRCFLNAHRYHGDHVVIAYTALILATHNLYCYLKSLTLVSDIDFGDLWSMILMESLVYWTPTHFAALASFAVCSAAIAYSYRYRASADSIIPDRAASYLASVLALQLFTPTLFLLAKADEYWTLNHLLCTVTAQLLLATLIMQRRVEKYLNVGITDDESVTKEKQRLGNPTAVEVEPPAAPPPTASTVEQPETQQRLTEVVKQGNYKLLLVKNKEGKETLFFRNSNEGKEK